MSSKGFFSSFREFEREPGASLTEEFERLAISRNWKVGGKKYRKNRGKCFASEFDRLYGTDGSKIAGWQRLCLDVGIDPCPGSITACRKALKAVNVNIYDLVDARARSTEVRLFPSKAALRDYSIGEDKIFPKKAAKKDGFLHGLLIHMFGR
ncbi:hypothetical protein AOQ84DRAFT_304476 [Glonium stellatum]|uniref:Uncharacterized protein n=1 Tax=Glonium stellatum TaxID=574774 RepID=A0A8E2EPL7_9PEZI|nr:hypothetical protein AOQ84DRAFT_304476 [Glonium stellatum]